MRVYLPVTATILGTVLRDGALPGDADRPLTAFAVTAGLQARYPDNDVEELEYTALLLAARACLRLLDLDPAAARRRIVVCADVPDPVITVADEAEIGAVRVAAPVPMGAIASVHADDSGAEATVAAAVAVMIEADLGDPEAQQVVEDTEGHELSWYANQEIGALLELG